MAEILNLSFADYLDHPGYGSSDLRAFKLGPPAMVPWQRANRDDGTNATKIGQAAHCAILTPHLFGDSFVKRPDDMDFRTKVGREWRDSQTREILTADEWDQVAQIEDAFNGSRAQVCPDRAERSVIWACPSSSLLCKGRPDWFDDGAVYDLKISVVATRSFEDLAYLAHANGWLNQLAHNRAGLHAAGITSIKVGRLVVIAPKPPQHLRVWLLEVRENDMDFLEMDNENTRKAMAECVRSGHWPGTPDTWQTIELPASAAFNEADLEGAEEIPV